METLAALKQIEELGGVPEEQLNWLISKSDCYEIKEGETLFTPGDPINRLFIILKGEFTLRLKRNNQFVNVGHFTKNSITGMLPYSRAQSAQAYAEALSDATVISLEEKYFKEMIRENHELTTVFVHTMSTRIRQFTKQEQQDDKMMALGKLSAGLAHELNNPSAAVVRSSQELAKHLKITPEKFKNVIKIKLSDQEIDRINEVVFSKMYDVQLKMSLIEKSNLEDELMDWFDDHKIEDSDDLAANFVDFGLTVDDMESIAKDIPEVHRNPIFSWLNQVLTTEKLVDEIQDASQRINDLVSSVKSYTHMDQAVEKTPTDIHVGLNTTLTMLNHKLKYIEVIKNYEEDLPLTAILPSPINQVWTNLIDNAIDAMEDQETKQLTITTTKKGEFVNIEIADTGTGIPKDIQDKIFDPFFTTKAVGKGTGLGLEFVQQIIKVQHRGSIYLESKPGKTIFTICLPILAS
ncbi:ATP-binding protein [uncultured Algoriphagus sp.]|uniref:ATP-binding protein n=1 Tax=uncultured Algoriphagus sp. TaxID=417365 RepID=UPI0030EBE3F7|tara:strand:+ start:7023 stop:8414 length:1392 start_codon:yes stop_codon:yes gene_type:complete